RKGAGACNRAAAIVEPVTEDVPIRDVAHRPAPLRLRNGAYHESVSAASQLGGAVEARKPIPTTSMRNSLAKWGRARLLPLYATGARVFDTEMSQHPASGRPIKLVLHT